MARDIDPRSLIINANVGWCYYLAGDMDRAIEEEKNTLRLGPGFIVAHGYLAQAYLEKSFTIWPSRNFGKTVALSPGDMSRKAELGGAYARAGKNEDLRKFCKRFSTPPRKLFSAYDGAMLYAGMGKKQETLAGWKKPMRSETEEWRIWPFIRTLRFCAETRASRICWCG